MMERRTGLLGIKASTLILLLICSIYFVVYVDRVNISVAAGDLRQEFHLTNSELGVAFSAYAYFYAVIQLFGGWLADVLGPRLTMGIFGAIFSLATVLTGMAGSFTELVAARALLGLGEGPGLAVASRALASWTPPARWSLAQGLAHAASRVATAVTPPLVAMLIIAFSWRGSFLLVGVASFAWVIVWLAYFRDDPARHRGTTAEERAALVPQPRQRKRIPILPLFGRMLPVILVDFCYGWTLFVCLNWLPSFFRGQYGMDLAGSALFTSGVFVAGILGDMLGGLASDAILKRTGSRLRARRDVIVAGLLASMTFFAAVLLLHDLTAVSIALTFAFFCMELVIAPLWSVPMDIAPEYCGTASGFMNFGAATAGIISPWMFGRIIDLTGSWTLPFAFSVALMGVGAIAAFWMRPDRPFQPASSDAALSMT